ncbi:hypothetical protein CVT26_002951 [Gymnopilus dilepis]|uniref:HAT C-terminal dimerisation domain-containing protein n=1 Tax=Gymnopilus dilepis TaxID=231916 RepID=A0A409Y4P8_9AGAR|nr:hypothetical protein CVT26_002951 [Gymnopilus dilepis]
MLAEELRELELRKFSFAVKNSTTILLPEWYRTLKSLRLAERIMLHDVSTCWNSTYDMLEFSIKYQLAIDRMTAARDLNLCKYELVSVEWRIAGELHDVLKIFKDATLFFSRATPNLATLIPAMDHIDKVLATCSDLPYQFSPAICAALAIGMNALNKYYNKTDHSEVYRIAMSTFLSFNHLLYINFISSVLHPRHKLKYFKKHDWEMSWINTAHQIVRDEFERLYTLVEVEDGEGSNGVGNMLVISCSFPSSSV